MVYSHALIEYERTLLMISWVFFDVGNVMVNDVPVLALIYEMLFREVSLRNPRLTLLDLLKERERLISLNKDHRHYRTIGESYLGENAWQALWNKILDELDTNYDDYNILIPGLDAIFADLAGSFKLGIAANQVRACRKALQNAGLLHYFSIVGISAEMNLAKPDLRFFSAILAQTGCLPEQCVMVGDRIDFDIRPAKTLGMRTIWAQFEHSNGHDHPREIVRLYAESNRRAAISRLEPERPEEMPDITVTSLAELPGAVRTLAGMP